MNIHVIKHDIYKVKQINILIKMKNVYKVSFRINR